MVKKIDFDGTGYSIEDAFLSTACVLFKAGSKPERVSIHPDSMVALIKAGVSHMLWTGFGMLDIKPSNEVGPKHATFYDESGNIVAEVTLGA